MVETEQTASMSGSTHTGDRGPYRTGHVLVQGVGVVDVPELMRQHAAMKLSLIRADQQLGGYRETIAELGQKVQEQKNLEADLRRTIVAMDSGWTPAPHVPPQLAEFVQAALEELAHAKAKHGENCIDGPGYTEHQRLAIVMEELGEVAHELTYDSDKPRGVEWSDGSVEGATVEGGNLGRLLGEMVQVAAMVLGWGATLMPGQAAQMPAEPTATPGRVVVAEGEGWSLGGLWAGDSEARTEDHHPGRGGW